jgi:UBX domain-containing protein 1/4
MLVRKAEQAEKDKKEAKANEVRIILFHAKVKTIRRKRDQESATLIEEAKHKEQLRQIEKDKQLKREEVEAKRRIKEQIEADKRARKERVRLPNHVGY